MAKTNPQYKDIYGMFDVQGFIKILVHLFLYIYKSLYIKHSIDVTTENEFKHSSLSTPVPHEQSMERNAATFKFNTHRSMHTTNKMHCFTIYLFL